MKHLTNIQSQHLSKILLNHSDHLCSAGEEFFQIMLWADSPTKQTKIIQHKFIDNRSSEVIAA